MKIAIIGFGTVGSGVAQVFYKNRERIEKKAGKALDAISITTVSTNNKRLIIIISSFIKIVETNF